MVKKLNCSLHLFNDAEANCSFATEFHHLWTPTVLIHCSDNGNRTRTPSRYWWVCYHSTIPSESLVADLGVEPSISEVMGLEWYFRSTHPRYELVGLAGFEPATWCSQSIRSTSWAIARSTACLTHRSYQFSFRLVLNFDLDYPESNRPNRDASITPASKRQCNRPYCICLTSSSSRSWTVFANRSLNPLDFRSSFHHLHTSSTNLIELRWVRTSISITQMASYYLD